MKNILFALVLQLLTLTINNIVEAQQVKNNPRIIEQVRALLASKGLSETEVKERLLLKNIDIDKMSEQEIIASRPIIEATIVEMEAEKLNPKSNLSSNKNEELVKIIDLNEDSIFKAKQQLQKVSNESISKSISPINGVYGHNIFKDNSLQAFRISKDASPPDTYILAPGDKINIIIFGKSQADLQYEVNFSGYIQPSQMPKIFLSGLTLKEARDLLLNRFSQFYVFSKDQFALTLNTSRTINLNIFGEVEKAGSYTTSALNTALNALAVTGGPTSIGSVRKIQIMRGSVKKVLDVYAFMRNPILQFDFYLQNNDIIYVPPAEKIVTIEGAINRPMQYELIDGEGIQELISFAGGLKSNIYSEFIQIERFENNEVIVKDYSLDDIQKNKLIVILKNGDIVRLKKITTEIRDIVSINGAVDYAGTYELSTTIRLTDLLRKAKWKTEAKMDQIFLIRKNSDQTSEVYSLNANRILQGLDKDIFLQKKDEVLIYEQSRFIDQFSITVLGEVRSPFERYFRFDQTISISEALGLAGNIKPSASNNGYVFRTNPFNNRKTEYIPVHLINDLNFVLKPGDKLVVLDKDLFKQDFTVSITGEVNKPFSTRYDSTLKIRDLMKLAGGSKISSNLNNIDIFRINFHSDKSPTKSIISLAIDKDYNPLNNNNFELKPFDIVVVRQLTEFSLQDIVTISGEVTSPGVYVLTSKKYHFSNLIEQSEGFNKYADKENISLIRYIDSSGLVVFNANKALNNKENLAKDPILLPGDIINVPRLNNLVKIETLGTKYILGSNQKLLQINFQGNRSAKWYINNYAGGFDKRADRMSVLVIRDNGIVSRTSRSFLFFKNYPNVTYGDRVLTALKPIKPEKAEKKGLDWDKFMSKVLALGTTIAILLTATK
jgi:protein involved in polysaccharide export with SLBB domain